MRRILFTGPRKLTVPQRDKVWEVAKRYLPENFGENCLWVLGDAPGVDTMLGELAQSNDCHYLRLNVKQELQADIRWKIAVAIAAKALTTEEKALWKLLEVGN